MGELGHPTVASPQSWHAKHLRRAHGEGVLAGTSKKLYTDTLNKHARGSDWAGEKLVKGARFAHRHDVIWTAFGCVG